MEKKFRKMNLVEIGDGDDLVSAKDFAAIVNILIEGVNDFRTDINSSVNNSEEKVVEITEKLDKFTTFAKDRLKEVDKVADDNLSTIRKELADEVRNLKNSIDDLELQAGERGEDGDDAEITEELKEELVNEVFRVYKLKEEPKIRKELMEAIAEAVKKIPPGQTTIIHEGGDYGTPFEVPIKQGSGGIVVRKDASGAYVISYTGGGSSITVTEVDGLPSVTASTLKFPNGSVTDEGGGVARITFSGGGLTKETPVGTINDVNVTFTVSNQPFFINVNGAIYEVGDGAYASYVAGTITLNYPVGTGGFIKSYY